MYWPPEHKSKRSAAWYCLQSGWSCVNTTDFRFSCNTVQAYLQGWLLSSVIIVITVKSFCFQEILSLEWINFLLRVQHWLIWGNRIHPAKSWNRRRTFKYSGNNLVFNSSHSKLFFFTFFKAERCFPIKWRSAYRTHDSEENSWVCFCSK